LKNIIFGGRRKVSITEMQSSHCLWGKIHNKIFRMTYAYVIYVTSMFFSQNEL